MRKVKFTFDKSAKIGILKLFGKTVDEQGYIVDADNPSAKICTGAVDDILKLKEFVGIKYGVNGDPVFIKSDLHYLINTSDYLL